jgi:hypothetical protein
MQANEMLNFISHAAQHDPNGALPRDRKKLRKMSASELLIYARRLVDEHARLAKYHANEVAHQKEAQLEEKTAVAVLKSKVKQLEGELARLNHKMSVEVANQAPVGRKTFIQTKIALTKDEIINSNIAIMKHSKPAFFKMNYHQLMTYANQHGGLTKADLAKLHHQTKSIAKKKHAAAKKHAKLLKRKAAKINAKAAAVRAQLSSHNLSAKEKKALKKQLAHLNRKAKAVKHAAKKAAKKVQKHAAKAAAAKHSAHHEAKHHANLAKRAHHLVNAHKLS